VNQVHLPIFDPGTVLQLALFKETGPRTSRRTSMVGLLRLRLSSLSTDVAHHAVLPMCASRKNGGERTASADLSIQASAKNCLPSTCPAASALCHTLFKLL
jgi:hypothetical protein